MRKTTKKTATKKTAPRHAKPTAAPSGLQAMGWLCADHTHGFNAVAERMALADARARRLLADPSNNWFEAAEETMIGLDPRIEAVFNAARPALGLSEFDANERAEDLIFDIRSEVWEAAFMTGLAVAYRLQQSLAGGAR